MGRLVKCAFCEKQVDKDIAVRYHEKNFHFECAKKQEEKDILMEYVCKLFGLKRPGPTVYSQLKTFMEKNNYYTYKGVLNALKYFYEIQKNSTKKSNQGIGIVPYVYDEAAVYFENVDLKQEVIKNKLIKQLENQGIQTIKASEPVRSRVKTLDLSIIEEGE